MSSQNNIDAKVTSKLSRGNVATNGDIKPTEQSGSTLHTGNIGQLITSLNSISPGILAIAKLSGSNIKKFDNVMTKIIDIVNKLAEATTKNEKGLKNTKIVAEILTELSKGVVDAKKLLIAAPIAALGLKMTRLIIDEVNVIVDKINSINGLGDESTIKKTQNINELINSLTKVVVGAVLLVTICIGIGTLILLGPTKKLILGGLLFLGLTVATIIILAGVIWLAALIIKGTNTMDNMKTIIGIVLASVLLVAVCVGLGIIIEKVGGLKSILYGFSVLVLVLVAVVGLAWVISIAAKLAVNKTTANNMMMMIGFILGTMLIIFVSKYLGDFIKENFVDILEGIAATTTLLLGIAGLAYVIGKVANHAKKGAVSVAIVEGLIIGAMAIVWLIMKLIKSKEEAGIGWDDIALELLAVGGVITAFGLLAGAFGLIAEFVLAGAIALGATELIALGAIGLVHKLIKLHLATKETGITWEDLKNTVLASGGVVGAFGILASAFSLLLIPITLAIPAMAITVKFAHSVIGVMRTLVKLSTEVDKAGGAEKLKNLMNHDIPSILKCFNKDNLNVDIGIVDLLKLSAKYAIISSLVLSILVVAKALSTIAKISGAVTESGEIRPLLHIDKETGQLTYGEPVNLANVANAISSAVRVFVENSQYGFQDVVRMQNATDIFKIIGSIVDPVNKFTKMVTSFMPNPNNPNQLAIINYDKDGNAKPGQLVDVVQVSTAIAGAITSFINTLYSEENVTSWGQRLFDGKWTWTGYKNGAKSANKMNELFAAMVDPVSKFVKLISAYQSSDGKTLQKVTTDKEGNVIISDQAIDVVSVANAMANSISSFINAIYNEDNWKMDDNVTDKALSFLNGPVSKLIELSGKLSENGAAEKIDKTSKALQKFMDDFVIKKMKWGRVHVNNFSTAVGFLKKRILEFDNVLVKDSDKRMKALDEFGNKLKEIMDVLNDNKDNLNNLNSTMDKASTWEGPKQKTTTTTNETPGPISQQAIGNNNTYQSITKDDLETILQSLNLHFDFSTGTSGTLTTSETAKGQIYTG